MTSDNALALLAVAGMAGAIGWVVLNDAKERQKKRRVEIMVRVAEDAFRAYQLKVMPQDARALVSSLANHWLGFLLRLQRLPEDAVSRPTEAQALMMFIKYQLPEIDPMFAELFLADPPEGMRLLATSIMVSGTHKGTALQKLLLDTLEGELQLQGRAA